MNIGIEVELSPRIQKHCLNLWQDKYYKHAAREAVVQVELALKEKGLVSTDARKFGKTLVDSLFSVGGKHKAVKLRVPLGEELQHQARDYFKAVFGYYRNYLAHDGSRVDQKSCLRILVIASELLDLIDASSLSYSDIGGVEGLLQTGIFVNEEQLLGVLTKCENYTLIGHDASGLREDLFMEYAAMDEHLDSILELDLVRYNDTGLLTPDFWGRDVVEEGGWLELTDLGWKIVNEIESKNSKTI